MKNIYVKTIACLVFLMVATAQAQTVNGLVTSDDGPLPGATIVVKGTNNGTTADFDGNFSINATADDILVVSFVGFASQEVAVNGQDQISVYLQTDNELEEVVVTGYGSQRSKKITSAVVKVDADEFLAERGREMFQESTRCSDQIRFGKYYAGADDGKGTTVSPAYKNVMPIPLDAINAANGSLSQNEGY